MIFYERFCVWIGQLKLSRIIISVSVILFLVPLVTHYYLSKYESTPGGSFDNPLRHTLDIPFGDFSTMTATDLKIRIEEMLRIKASVSTELRELEARRGRLQREAAAAAAAADDARAHHARALLDLQRVRASAEQARLAQIEATRRDSPKLAPPERLLPSAPPPHLPPPDPNELSKCRMHNCFDYSRCSLSSGFPVYFYDPDEYSPLTGAEIDGFLKTSLRQTLGYNPHFTNDPNIACIYIVLIGEAFPIEKNPTTTDKYTLYLNVSGLSKLPYWGGDGRNHVLLNLARRALGAPGAPLAGRAMLAQAAFTDFREGFDVVMPPALGPPAGDVWKECAPIAPARRMYLLSFQGSQAGVEEPSVAERQAQLAAALAPGGGEQVNLQWACEPPVLVQAARGDWVLCGTERSRHELLQQSTFVLVPAPSASSALMQARLYEALRAGAIPVVLGNHAQLPFSEYLDWRRAAIVIPEARARELRFLLRSFPDSDLLSFRRQGRVLWERYLSSLNAATAALVATLRSRSGLPPPPPAPVSTPPGFATGLSPPAPAPPPLESAPDEALGPMEPPSPSPAYTRNFSYNFLHGYEVWNDWLDPFTLYPQVPWEPPVTSDARFIGSPGGFRVIGGGAGGAGKEFAEALGGDRPKEQFTIVILTYEREAVLAAALARLRGLPYLNKVVVVWNGMSSPETMTSWPESGAPIAVVRASKNSLNNRFMPYDVIETEAVLCVDDDAHLRHDEIIFAFRVWRENRDRIVGFPGRYHAWDLNYNNGFLYNSNYSCELSMVLTGAAFIHRYYMWAYWSMLPNAIREYVDEYMNCEDIAMNFLVSHITRKPPVKVTSRWTFRCPGCPVTLSADETHFNERHKCMQFFAEVMGYTPLMVTQYRADSVLFKTRIPHDKQKCFKFI